MWIVGAGVLCVPMAVVSWFAGGWARRHPGIAPMLLGALVLAITFAAASSPGGPGMVILAVGVVASVGLGWLGYKVHFSESCDPASGTIDIPALMWTVCPASKA